MKEYSFTEARQNFASLLEEAKKDGAVCIKKKNGETYFLKPASNHRSPLHIASADLGLSATDIVNTVRAGRERK